MDTEIKEAFKETNATIEKLVEGVFALQTEVRTGFRDAAEDRQSLRQELQSLRRNIEELPEEVERIYGATINDLLERVSILEKQATTRS